MTRTAPAAHARTGHAAWLYALAALFGGRVLAQRVAAMTGWSWLPAFDDWQSGALPYAWLLGLQLVLVGWMLRTAHRVRRGVGGFSRRRGQVLAGIAAVYGGIMVTRLVLGLTWFRGHWWLDHPLPTLFHLVITTFLAVAAHYHLHEQSHPLARS